MEIKQYHNFITLVKILLGKRLAALVIQSLSPFSTISKWINQYYLPLDIFF